MMERIETKVLGLITARGGSKSIPRKNVVPLAGKPLIAWTIEAALNSSLLDRVVVSTDDEEIREVAQRWGAEVPFMRPAELAQDDSPHIPVIIHAVEWLESQEGKRWDYVLLLQPTSPLRSAEDIDGAIELACEREADGVVSVHPAPSHPYFTKRITADGRLEDFVTKPEGYLRRQDLPPAYALNGAIYLIRCESLIEEHSLFPPRTYAQVMPVERSLDIDTEWDLHLGELILADKHGA